MRKKLFEMNTRAAQQRRERHRTEESTSISQESTGDLSTVAIERAEDEAVIDQAQGVQRCIDGQTDYQYGQSLDRYPRPREASALVAADPMPDEPHEADQRN